MHFLAKKMCNEIHSSTLNCFGYCQDCDCVHSLGSGNTKQHCLELMSQLEAYKNIDFSEQPDKTYSTDYLYTEARGQMFGVLECIDSNNNIHILKAFSGQYNGHWTAPAWVPPILNLSEYRQVVPKIEKKIKELSKNIETCEQNSESYKALKNARKSLSQKLMKDIHAMYQLTNFRKETRSLSKAFYEKRGIPTGTADCCAPKLLHYAATNKLTPIGLSEFYWGKENRSKTRKHKQFYDCCKNKCQPILGYLLCGL